MTKAEEVPVKDVPESKPVPDWSEVKEGSLLWDILMESKILGAYMDKLTETLAKFKL